MRTDDLVAMLARETAPAYRNGAQRLAFALGAGAVVSAVLMVVSLGVRPDLAQAARLSMFWVKIIFPALLGIGSLHLFRRLAHPGLRVGRAPVGIVTPILAMVSLAVTVLILAAPGERAELIFGSTWRSCPFNIAFLSLPVLIAAVWCMRGGAPTRPRLAGAACGLVAGALAAIIYALHCPELAAPFIAIWYLLGMLIPTVVGALLAPILRW
jgi:hypothetical protein